MKKTQRVFQFPQEPAGHTSFKRPSYERKLEDGHDGISPREAFLRAETLLAEKTEIEIAESLYNTMQFEREALWNLLTQMYVGRRTLDVQQFRKAALFAMEFYDLTPLEQAWWTFELNVSPLAEKRLVRKQSIIFINKFRHEMGKFRRAIQQILPSPVQSGDSFPPRIPGEANEQSAQ